MDTKYSDRVVKAAKVMNSIKKKKGAKKPPAPGTNVGSDTGKNISTGSSLGGSVGREAGQKSMKPMDQKSAMTAAQRRLDNLRKNMPQARK